MSVANADEEVTFRAKSSWQKCECLMPTHAHRESTIEAVCGTAAVRCCENAECKAYASEIASRWGIAERS